MSKIKNFISMVLCGMSAITLFPNTDYGKDIPKSPAEAIAKAWRTTGENMQKAIDKVQFEYEQTNYAK